jgi:hypothetical protein
MAGDTAMTRKGEITRIMFRTFRPTIPGRPTMILSAHALKRAVPQFIHFKASVANPWEVGKGGHRPLALATATR